MDPVYTYFESHDQPSEFRTFRAGLRAQRKQLAILTVVFLIGFVVALTYSSFGGGTIMSGTGVALVGTLVACRYY